MSRININPSNRSRIEDLVLGEMEYLVFLLISIKIDICSMQPQEIELFYFSRVLNDGKERRRKTNMQIWKFICHTDMNSLYSINSERWSSWQIRIDFNAMLFPKGPFSSVAGSQSVFGKMSLVPARMSYINLFKGGTGIQWDCGSNNFFFLLFSYPHSITIRLLNQLLFVTNWFLLSFHLLCCSGYSN